VTATKLRPLAEADLIERTRYDRREGAVDIGERFFDAAIRALGAIGRMPGAGSPAVLADIEHESDSPYVPLPHGPAIADSVSDVARP
jgi:hypothetical protein